MKKALLSTLILFISFVHAQEVSIAERLGYPADAKLFIIHADDIGVSHSENVATIKSMENGFVNSGSIMVPCPWFPEIAAYAKENAATTDFGLHLTITAEWKNYKWGPVTSKDSVPSLLNDREYFYPLTNLAAENCDPNEVAIEMRRQIERAYNFGINVTHLDAHMGAVMSTPEFLTEYIKLGREYKIPVLLTAGMPHLEEVSKELNFTERDVIVDKTYQAYPEVFESGMEAYYVDMLNNLEPGLNCLLIHVAYDDSEMRAVTIDHPHWGAAWRQADYDFFTSDLCRGLLEQNEIQLVTWKEIRDKIVRAN